MKTILFLLFAALSFAEVHERRATVDGRKYIVKYDVPMCNPPKEYGNCMLFVPSTMPAGQPHYSATISVFDNKKIQVGQAFPGQWTHDGCFEDDPVALVEKALGHDHGISDYSKK